MIPCYVCTKDASTGWTVGFSPAPDSQKLALCAAHDTPENREYLKQAWEKLQQKELSAFALLSRQKASPVVQVATVHFSGGGMLSFTCTAVTPTEQGTLRIEQLDGTQTFIPMQHIREYSLHPYLPHPSDPA